MWLETVLTSNSTGRRRTERLRIMRNAKSVCLAIACGWGVLGAAATGANAAVENLHRNERLEFVCFCRIYRERIKSHCNADQYQRDRCEC